MSLIREAVEWLLPHKCDICGKVADVTADDIPGYKDIYGRIFHEQPGLYICGKCFSQLVPLEEPKGWTLCLSDPMSGDPYPELALFAPFPYDEICEKAIPAIKFRNKKEIARLFGIILGKTVKDNGIKADLVAAVPLSEERFLEREFNQAEEIARPVAYATGVPFATGLLERCIDTRKQTELKGGEARFLNVKGAFRISPEWDVTDLTILLTDDVATTGATLHEAARVLLDAGAARVLCIAFASNRTVKNKETV